MSSKRLRDGVGIDPNRIVSAAVDAALGQSEPSKKKHHPGRMLAAGAAVAAAATVGQRRMPALAKAPLRVAAHKLGNAMHVDDLVGAVQDRMGRDRQPDDYDDEDLDRVDPDSDEFDDEDLDDEEPEDLENDEDSEEPLDEADDLDDEDEDEGFDDEDDQGFDDEPEDGDGPEGEGDADEPDEEYDDDPEAESEHAPVEEEPLEDDEPEDEAPFEDEEQLEDEEDAEDGEEDDEQVAARGLDLGVVSEPRRTRPRDQAPDLFAALRTPRRRAPLMGRGALRVDPATRPPEPERSRGKQNGDRRNHNSNSMAARR